MEKYKIKYNYNTGDSFGTRTGLEEELEIQWDTLMSAKANLVRIKEHYQQYQELNSFDSRKKRTDKQILDSNKNKDWFVAKDRLGHDDKSASENQIILYTDEGQPFQFWAPWCGYFEHLNFCEIVVSDDEESGTKFYT